MRWKWAKICNLAHLQGKDTKIKFMLKISERGSGSETIGKVGSRSECEKKNFASTTLFSDTPQRFAHWWKVDYFRNVARRATMISWNRAMDTSWRERLSRALSSHLVFSGSSSSFIISSFHCWHLGRNLKLFLDHCCGSVTCWCGSGSSCLWPMDPGPDLCDGCNINLNPDSKKTGIPRRCNGSTFSSRSEITGGLSSNLPSALHRYILLFSFFFWPLAFFPLI